MVKKILLFSFIVILGLFFLFKTPCQAAYTKKDMLGHKTAVEDDTLNLEQTTSYVAEASGWWITDQFVGDLEEPLPSLSSNGPVNYQNYGLYGHLAFLSSNLYAMPASIPIYLADISQRLRPTTVLADEGFSPYPGGFSALRPVLRLWRAFRNLTYLFFIVIFIFVGFGIMFRQKIDPQTTISITNALPKIVVALILVTFSYAISALIIDFLALSTQIIALLLENNKITAACLFNLGGTCDNPNTLINLNVFHLINQIFITPPVDVSGLFEGGRNVIVKTLNILISLTDLTKELDQDAPNVIVSLVFSIAIVYAAFRIFFALLTRYVQLIIGTIFSPIIFLISAFGQGKEIAKHWFKAQIANALCFPVVFLLIFIAASIAHQPSGVGSAPNWQPDSAPPKFDWAPEMIGGRILTQDTDALAAIIAFGILMIIPNIPTAVENAIHGKGIQMPIDMGDIKKAARFIPLVGSFIG